MKPKFYSLIIYLLVSICSANSLNAQKIEKEVLKASRKWISNFNRGNVSEIVNAYTNDAVMVAKPFGTYRGRSSINEFWSSLIKDGATNLKYFNTYVKVINRKKAIISSDWSMNIRKGIITNETWVKVQGVWKLETDHFEVTKQFNNVKKESKMNKKETFILVHSAWLGGWQWENVSNILKENGHTVLTPDLPGHGKDKTPPSNITMEDYVKTITELLDKQDAPVVLVGHSFNGITVSRVAELRPNKIKKLVFLTAFLLPNKGSFFKAVQNVKGSKAVDNFMLSEDKTFAFVKEDEIQNAFAHDIPKSAFETAKPYIVPEPIKPLMYELQITDKNFGSVPKFYIECTEDRAIPIEIQRAMYKGKVKKSFSLNSSHTPNFSQPKELANILMNLN